MEFALDAVGVSGRRGRKVYLEDLREALERKKRRLKEAKTRTRADSRADDLSEGKGGEDDADTKENDQVKEATDGETHSGPTPPPPSHHTKSSLYHELYPPFIHLAHTTTSTGSADMIESEDEDALMEELEEEAELDERDGVVEKAYERALMGF